MDKHMKAENTYQNFIYQQITEFLNPLFLGRLIPDRENEILSLKLRGDL